MVNTMGRVANALWRAVAYCLHPQVILMSLLPLLIAAGLALGLGYFYWESALDGVRATLVSWKVIDTMLSWLDFVDATSFRSALAIIITLALALPVIVVLSLLLVALMMTPALVDLVARRRFPTLERKKGGGVWQSVFWSLSHALLALFLLVVSMPFWLIPPLVLILPPLIWGWLSYRVFAFDALAEHASVIERRRILKEHRVPLLLLGLVTGYLGAAPTAIWALGGVMSLALAPFLIVGSIWLYTLVFAFATLWFSHYCLAALNELRNARADAEPDQPRRIEVTEVIDAPPSSPKPPAPLAPPPPYAP